MNTVLIDCRKIAPNAFCHVFRYVTGRKKLLWHLDSVSKCNSRRYKIYLKSKNQEVFRIFYKKML